MYKQFLEVDLIIRGLTSNWKIDFNKMEEEKGEGRLLDRSARETC